MPVVALSVVKVKAFNSGANSSWFSSNLQGIGILLLAGALSACSSFGTDKTEALSPNNIYSEAKDEIKSGAFDKAITLFEKLEGRAAGTPLAQQAQLEKAYALFKSGEKAQAIATLDRFMKLHPASPAIDYALYLKGLVNFNDNLGLLGAFANQDLAERDQKASRDSFETLKELVQRFPESRYAPDSRQRMTYIINSLAQYEVYVARYYFTRKAYVAAIARAQTAVTDFNNVPAAEEALFIITKSYEALGLAQLRDDSRRVLEKSFPKSEFLTKGFRSSDAPWWRLW